jgi:hypothetical protein
METERARWQMHLCSENVMLSHAYEIAPLLICFRVKIAAKMLFNIIIRYEL